MKNIGSWGLASCGPGHAVQRHLAIEESNCVFEACTGDLPGVHTDERLSSTVLP